MGVSVRLYWRLGVSSCVAQFYEEDDMVDPRGVKLVWCAHNHQLNNVDIFLTFTKRVGGVDSNAVIPDDEVYAEMPAQT